MPLMNNAEMTSLHPDAVAGAFSKVTKREAEGDKSVTLDKHEKSVLHALIPTTNIVRKGGATIDNNPSHHKFMVWNPSSRTFEEGKSALTFPKKGKSELRLYFKKDASANFYPSEGQAFFILEVQGDSRPYIGAMDSTTFNGTISTKPTVRSFTKGLIIDEEDTDYQTLVHEPNAAGGARQSTRNTFNRSITIARTAIGAAKYECQHDKTHWSFVSGATGKLYLEPHHLVPISLQSEFTNTLDCVANIIVLCPNCHRAIHYGDIPTKRAMLTKFLGERVSDLKKSGVDVSLNYLLEKYGVE